MTTMAMPVTTRTTTRTTSAGAARAARRIQLPVVVSATTLDADGEIRGMVRPVVPNYALRRFVAAVAAAVVLIVALGATAGLLAGFGGTPAAASGATPAPAAPVAGRHVAVAGDTLWSIASTYRGEVAHDRYLDALVRLNGSPAIEAGQAVWLP